MHNQISEHRQDVINNRKINAGDIESYTEWKEIQIEELQREIDDVRWYGLTNGCS